MMSAKKCLLPTPLCISRRITKISSSCKHWHKIWSYYSYNFASLMVKGNAFNTNLFCCFMEYPFGRFLVEMYVYISSCSHFGWNKNSYASIILYLPWPTNINYQTPRIFGNIRKLWERTTIKWDCTGFYTTNKSYSSNNYNHLVIRLNNWSFFYKV
jgi:hypothetical protein